MTPEKANMTGAEHYREAEQRLAAANRPRMHDDQLSSDELSTLYAEAQVHATLALAGATAALIPSTEPGGQDNTAIIRDWASAGAW